MVPHIRHLRAIRRRAWTLILLSLLVQLGQTMLDPTRSAGNAAQAAPIKEFRR